MLLIGVSARGDQVLEKRESSSSRSSTSSGIGETGNRGAWLEHGLVGGLTLQGCVQPQTFYFDLLGRHGV